MVPGLPFIKTVRRYGKPRVGPGELKGRKSPGINEQPSLNLNAGYCHTATDSLPRDRNH